MLTMRIFLGTILLHELNSESVRASDQTIVTVLSYLSNLWVVEQRQLFPLVMVDDAN